MSDRTNLPQPLVLFDGVCNLCNTSVDFLVRNEKGNSLKFASLQSEIGQTVIAQSNLSKVPDSILLYENGVLKYKSRAILTLCNYLRFPFNLGAIFRIVPTTLADLIYDWVARNRYSWFGKKNTCRVPTAEEREKFLG